MSTETGGAMSVPLYRKDPPRPLTDAEHVALISIADALIAPSGGVPGPGELPDYPVWLVRALAARRDVFDVVLETTRELTDAPGNLRASLRTLSATSSERFEAVSAVVAGAYLMVPSVRAEIGYPGPERKHPRFDEAADEIMDGILDPVIARGNICRPA